MIDRADLGLVDFSFCEAERSSKVALNDSSYRNLTDEVCSLSTRNGFVFIRNCMLKPSIY